MSTRLAPGAYVRNPDLIAACSVALLACASTQKPSETAAAPVSAATTPFFQETPLPSHSPPFDQVHDSDYLPAFEAGMARDLDEVRAIAHDPAAPTFENTFV